MLHHGLQKLIHIWPEYHIHLFECEVRKKGVVNKHGTQIKRNIFYRSFPLITLVHA